MQRSRLEHPILSNMDAMGNGQDTQVTEACQMLINALRLSLHEYKETRPNLSWRSVARNIRCNRYILNKIISDDGDVSEDKTYDVFGCFRMAAILSRKNLRSSKSLSDAVSGLYDVIRLNPRESELARKHQAIGA